MTLSLVPISKSIQKLPFDCGYPILNDYFHLRFGFIPFIEHPLRLFLPLATIASAIAK